jgi:hypothetical protein
LNQDETLLYFAFMTYDKLWRDNHHPPTESDSELFKTVMARFYDTNLRDTVDKDEIVKASSDIALEL